MAAPTGATLLLPAEKQHFHLIRPVCAPGAFPSRGRHEDAFSLRKESFFSCLQFHRLQEGRVLRGDVFIFGEQPVHRPAAVVLHGVPDEVDKLLHQRGGVQLLAANQHIFHLPLAVGDDLADQQGIGGVGGLGEDADATPNSLMATASR